MTLIELKARMYDLLAQKQTIEMEMQKTNQAITNWKEPKPEVKEEAAG